MMSRLKNIFFVLLVIPIISVEARGALYEKRRLFIEGKGADYISTDHLFRKIYGEHSGIFSAELTGQLYRWLYGWAAIGLLVKDGRSIGEHTLTRLIMIPVSFGLKYLKQLEYGDWYFGMGAVVPHVHIEDKSPYVSDRSRWGIGGNWKLGMNINISESVFFDIFGEYTYLKMDFDNDCCRRVVSHKANLSGASLGLGIGYRF